MARARGIKPGFFHDADVVDLPMEARLLFIGLWTVADRAGRLEDKPKQIKMDVFPADNVDVDELLDKIAATGMLKRYQVDGKRYLQVVSFTKHQNPHRDEKPSTIPEPPQHHGGVNETPCKHHASTMQAPCKPDAGTVAIGLTPDSCILTPDSLTGGAARAHTREPAPDGAPPPFLPEYREFIKTERPALDADVVFANFCDHHPPRKRTLAQWKKWVRAEFEPPTAGPPPATADPDSKASIEALGMARGIGKWDQLREPWATYKKRAKGQPT